MTAPTACIIGWPVAHSRSPVIHRFWLRQMGLAGDYVPVAVEPERIETFFIDFAQGPYVGGNITVPHKEVAFTAVAERDEAANAIGAVNTLWIDGGKLIGSNTDALGFLANLDEAVENWDRTPGPAVVLGAGGASRAIIFALAARGFAPIHLVNRTLGRAEALATRFGKMVKPTGWNDVHRCLAEARILVNTTTLGMDGAPALDLGLAALPEDAIVTDLVYTPLETPLLAAARLCGLRTVDGLGMLLHQAVPGFERWFGKRPQVTPALRQAVLSTFGA